MASQRVEPILSSYAKSLEKQVKDRYIDKISCIGHIDPYVLPENQFDKDIRALSPVDYVDMVNYFMLKISFYTAKQFKAKKSLEAYNQLQMDEQFTNVPSSACIEM